MGLAVTSEPPFLVSTLAPLIVGVCCRKCLFVLLRFWHLPGSSSIAVYMWYKIVVLVVQWLSVGLVIERSLVRLPAGAQLGQLGLPSLWGR